MQDSSQGWKTRHTFLSKCKSLCLVRPRQNPGASKTGILAFLLCSIFCCCFPAQTFSLPNPLFSTRSALDGLSTPTVLWKERPRNAISRISIATTQHHAQPLRSRGVRVIPLWSTPDWPSFCRFCRRAVPQNRLPTLRNCREPRSPPLRHLWMSISPSCRESIVHRDNLKKLTLREAFCLCGHKALGNTSSGLRKLQTVCLEDVVVSAAMNV